MLEKTTRILSENLARSLNRRSFLQRVGQTTFAGIAALAAGHGGMRLAAASTGSDNRAPLGGPQCAPPGPFCNINGTILDGCRGSSCFQHRSGGTIYQCRVYYTYYQAGCWTTHVSGGYWTCCDCECGTPRVATCGCAQFSSTPVPRPDRGESGTKS